MKSKPPVREKPELVFFYSHESCPARAAAMPVLAWLAEEHGTHFEGYVSVRPSIAGIGDNNPLDGNRHAESLYRLFSYHGFIRAFILAEDPAVPFERHLRLRGDVSIVKKSSQELIDFYQECFLIFMKPFPDHVVVFPSGVFSFPNEEVVLGDFVIPGKSHLDVYSYPDVFFRKSVAVPEDIFINEVSRLKSLGIRKTFLLFCSENTKEAARQNGFEVEIVDDVLPGDDYADITSRIVQRWLRHARGLALGNEAVTLRWTPKYLRERILPMAGVASLSKAVKKLAYFTEKVGNRFVWGSQIYNDHIISDASASGIVLSLSHDVEVGTTLVPETKHEKAWFEDTPAPWESEKDDEFLMAQIRSGRIPVCFVHYASDLGHLPVLPRYLDLHSLDGLDDGIAFPATWWDYADDRLELLLIGKDHGGVFPSSEPMVSSAGIGVATEAQGYLPADVYLDSLKKARQAIEERLGSRHVPLGHYPFQDAGPRYEHGTAEPQFDVVIEAGFEYTLTYKHEGRFPEIVYSSDRFLALNHQSLHWSFRPMEDVQDWENQLVGSRKPGWILIGLDSPFWGMVPCYFGWASKDLDLTQVRKAMMYARQGGVSGRLFLLKPHELVRFARILQTEQGVGIQSV